MGRLNPGDVVGEGGALGIAPVRGATVRAWRDSLVRAVRLHGSSVQRPGGWRPISADFPWFSADFRAFRWVFVIFRPCAGCARAVTAFPDEYQSLQQIFQKRASANKEVERVRRASFGSFSAVFGASEL